jgi:hypothetical protein
MFLSKIRGNNIFNVRISLIYNYQNCSLQYFFDIQCSGDDDGEKRTIIHKLRFKICKIFYLSYCKIFIPAFIRQRH